MYPSNYGGYNDTRAAKSLHGRGQGKRHEAGDDCAEVSFLTRPAVPSTSQKIARYSGFSFAKV